MCVSAYNFSIPEQGVQVMVLSAKEDGPTTWPCATAHPNTEGTSATVPDQVPLSRCCFTTADAAVCRVTTDLAHTFRRDMKTILTFPWTCYTHRFCTHELSNVWATHRRPPGYRPAEACLNPRTRAAGWQWGRSGAFPPLRADGWRTVPATPEEVSS
jgi:hypothetical protein